MKRLFSKNRWLGTILNVIGLTVSFTVFMIIMIQVLYDWRYDRNYPDNGFSDLNLPMTRQARGSTT